MEINWADILLYLAFFMITALVLAMLLAIWIWRRVKQLRLPPNVTFVQAMRLTPFSVVLLLDMLDLGLDIFSAPLSWAILSRLGLTKLRGASVLQALVPGTQVLPTMTIAWLLVRFFGPEIEKIPVFDEAARREERRRLQDIPKRYRF